MKDTFKELVGYLKNPVLEKDTNQENSYRFKKFLHLLIISILTGAALTPLFALIEYLGLVDMNTHAMEDLMKRMSKIKVFLYAGIAAPLLEELLFRAPITLFKSKKYFKVVFYAFALIFGFIHLSNFGITTNVLLLAPILVAPQIILGGYLGFIRVRFGLTWSMLLHASYNVFFVLITFTTDLM
ncbi:CPBP family intramembrane glutamic endopeptidase [Tenacibaculum sp. HL-MS23]|uniref:CPBP family intramembrane glutamic endopeptidase n=1 Tax=unclassified Tenacibaculum TaxID=2635139 RepID=UPI001C4F9FF5|nr:MULTISPECIES: CPBP family intramembrane glutamic endopeptidase [unclassified Tenacibaculum]QXP74352.1 CPBP family intramembrane metalloprotease [Tenacibaculum sp. AHE14PA]QXP75278.1 CPBP family intramembrane metalloprotease [Tenacibaculum sp. AHE15PA]WNW01820.1 CPBP family intramembrane glutamic endopeptidase [Tenacibaculum sp. HL-MS23]